MRIGELAERAGTTTRTLRYYEARGLLTARRAGNGYRAYGEEDLHLVRQIRLLQDFGFELEDTRPFVECLQAGHPAGGLLCGVAGRLPSQTGRAGRLPGTPRRRARAGRGPAGAC